VRLYRWALSSELSSSPDILAYMDASAWIALAAATVTSAALFYAGRAANAARELSRSAKDQTELQRRLRIDAAQPYIWVDIGPDEQHGQLLLLMIGNSGPTVATNVRVTFAPALDIPRSDTAPSSARGADARDLLRRGIASLPPGRVMRWTLGIAQQVLDDGYALPYTATITADGPFGPLPPLAYTINVDDVRHTLAVPAGTLHGVAQAVQGLTKTVDQLAKGFERS
jgi:hypothetical protein